MCDLAAEKLAFQPVLNFSRPEKSTAENRNCPKFVRWKLTDTLVFFSPEILVKQRPTNTHLMAKYSCNCEKQICKITNQKEKSVKNIGAHTSGSSNWPRQKTENGEASERHSNRTSAMLVSKTAKTGVSKLKMCRACQHCVVRDRKVWCFSSGICSLMSFWSKIEEKTLESTSNWNW